MGLHTEPGGPTEKSRAIENTLRSAALLGVIGATFVACGGLLGGQIGVLLGLGLGAIVVGGFWGFSDRLVIRASGARLLDAQSGSPLYAMLGPLSRRAAVPPPRLYVAPSPQPNAFAIGRSPRHATIVVTEGLLSLLEPTEVQAVLAHELTHIRRRDTLVTSMVGATASGVLAVVELAKVPARGHRRGRAEGPRTFSVSAICLAARLLRLTLSGSRESEADRAGSDLTGDAEAMARALTRMERYARVVPMNPTLGHASAWVVNPIGDRVDRAWLFATYPPIADRIDRLRPSAGRTVAARPVLPGGE